MVKQAVPLCVGRTAVAAARRRRLTPAAKSVPLVKRAPLIKSVAVAPGRRSQAEVKRVVKRVSLAQAAGLGLRFELPWTPCRFDNSFDHSLTFPRPLIDHSCTTHSLGPCIDSIFPCPHFCLTVHLTVPKS